MRTNLDNLQGKRVLIVGLARTGIAVCQTLLDMGAQVTVHDSKNESEFDKNFITYLKSREVACFFGSIPEDMSEFDMLILSPGVSPELPFIQEKRKDHDYDLGWRNIQSLGSQDACCR